MENIVFRNPSPEPPKPKDGSQTDRSTVSTISYKSDTTTTSSYVSETETEFSCMNGNDVSSVGTKIQITAEDDEDGDEFNNGEMDCVTRDILKSSNSRISTSNSRRMRPAWLERRDTVCSDDFNFDENEGNLYNVDIGT